MAKSMRNDKRKEKKLLETRAALVRAALNEGKLSRKDICEATDLKLHELTNLFTKDRDIYSEYVVRRRTIADIASDNILDIINNPDHPQHFQASKYILQNHKTELDDVLDSKGESEIEVEIKGDSTYTSPVTIKFSSNKDKE